MVLAAQDLRRRLGRRGRVGCVACGGAGGRRLNAAIAAVFRAVTWLWSRTVAPAPSAASWCRATTIPVLVAMSSIGGAEPVGDGDRGRRPARVAPSTGCRGRRPAPARTPPGSRSTHQRERGAGTGRSGSAAARSATVQRSRRRSPRRRVSPRRARTGPVGLGLLDGELVGQGAPPALRGGVVGLLHHTLAVPAPGRADRDLHPVVLRDRGERGGDPARCPGGTTVAIRSNRQTRVSPPRPRRPGPGASTRCGWSIDSASTPATCPECASAPTSRMRLRPQPPALGRVGQLEPVPLGFLPGGCSMTAIGRSVAGRQAVHTGRSPRPGAAG